MTETLSYTEHECGVGRLLLVRSASGLVKLSFLSGEADEELYSVCDRLKARAVSKATELDTVRRQLDEYLYGSRSMFTIELDKRLASGFRARVLDALLEIPYGTVASYADVANTLGSPNAARAVGSGCAKNPLPIIVPCHRVLRSDGSIGEYVGGRNVKSWLLRLEKSEHLA